MSLENKKNKQIFPDMPRGTEVIDSNKHWTPVWHQSMSQLYQALQHNFSNEGIGLPWLTTKQLTDFKDSYAPYITNQKPLPDTMSRKNGYTAFDIENSVPIVFIIKYNTSVNPQYPTAASWKTYTIT